MKEQPKVDTLVVLDPGAFDQLGDQLEETQEETQEEWLVAVLFVRST